MLVVALACLALAGLTVYLSFRLLRAERREFARERALIIDQLMHASGETGTRPGPPTMDELEAARVGKRW